MIPIGLARQCPPVCQKKQVIAAAGGCDLEGPGGWSNIVDGLSPSCCDALSAGSVCYGDDGTIIVTSFDNNNNILHVLRNMDFDDGDKNSLCTFDDKNTIMNTYWFDQAEPPPDCQGGLSLSHVERSTQVTPVMAIVGGVAVSALSTLTFMCMRTRHGVQDQPLLG